MKDTKVELSREERTACEVWTRVMGYFRPVTAFNKGKQSEYKERKCFKEDCVCKKGSYKA
ncbi:MAG: anaerobic ribonucleoside-triphosphate reductase [Holosporales bacterium]|nr:anaerobic ribonucleoside-triphosphate reductase [Holosporales bacterium]